MNKSYKIDKNTVLVTDQNGEIRLVPKYTSVEEILILENDIEKIDQVIAENHQTIENNKRDKYYNMHHKLIDIGWILLLILLTSIGLSFSSVCISILNVFFKPCMTIFGITFFASVVCCVLESKGNDKHYQNVGLLKDIEWLKKLKEEKTTKLKKLRKSVNQRLLPKEEQQLPEPVNPLEILKKFREYLTSGEIETSVYPFCQKFVELEEEAKQKTLGEK